MESSIIQMINQGGAVPLELGREPSKSTPDKYVVVSKVEPVSASINIATLILPEPTRILAGQFLKLEVNGFVYRLSILNIIDEKTVLVLIGGSSLNQKTVELLNFLNYSMRFHQLDPALRITEYGVSGNATCRIVGKHPTILIASGSGISYVNTILLEYIVKGMELLKTQEEIPPVALIWACHSPSEFFTLHEYLIDLSTKVPFFSYTSLAEVVHPWNETMQSSRGIDKGDLSSYLDESVVNEDLSKSIIYVGGSSEMFQSVSKILIEKGKADKRMIVSDNS